VKASARRLEALSSSFWARRKVVGLDAFADVADDFVGHAVHVPTVGACRWRWREVVGVGFVVHGELGVAVVEDGAIEACADEDVLEAALEEELDEEGLNSILVWIWESFFWPGWL